MRFVFKEPCPGRPSPVEHVGKTVDDFEEMCNILQQEGVIVC